MKDAAQNVTIADGRLRAELSVCAPYRLDLTVAALRRVSGNVVDVMTPNGPYLRALHHRDGVNVVEVRQSGPDTLDVQITGHTPQAQLRTVAAMLGTEVDLREWYERSRHVPWLERLAAELRGVKPPRYPELWEALCHGIIFQQLSITAAAAIMQRFVERFSQPREHAGVRLYPFPAAEVVDRSAEEDMQGLGLSRQKVGYLKRAAAAVVTRAITSATIDALSTDDAASELRTLAGIGRWTAANILLRGFGRLDVFPAGDSGVAQNIKLLSGDPHINLEDVLSLLGDVRGMLYFHLLLGRLRKLYFDEGRKR